MTRWRRWADFVVAQFSSRPPEKIDPPVRQILRLAIYELTERSTPPHAVVNEYVGLVRRLARPQAAAFANAVLRRIAEKVEALPEPVGPDTAENLAIRYSHPTWMVRRWLDRFGEQETRELLLYNNRLPVFGLRINPLRTTGASAERALTEAAVEWSTSPLMDDFLRIGSVQPVVRLGLLERGEAHIQDEAAGLVVRILDPQPGETIVDGCAAPGGKVLYACIRMQNRGRIVAIDRSDKRLRLAHTACSAAGCSIGEFHVADATSLPSELSSVRADRVLLDAPCSGFGVLAKRADLRWRRSPEDLVRLTALQDKLLDSLSQLVRPGGTLVYSTCTIEPEENEHRVDAFLSRNSAFDCENVSSVVPPEMVTEAGSFASLPQRHGIDGAFAARLRRRS